MLYHKTYFISEEKPWVTFVHGAGGSSSMWYPQIREFKEQFNVLLLDLRGHGKSSAPLFRFVIVLQILCYNSIFK